MPNSNELLQRLALTPPEDLEELVQEPANRPALDQLFGADAVEGMLLDATRAMSFAATDHPPKFVIIPGLMGSLLQSTRGRLDLLWINPASVLKGLINRLEMAPDGLRDADPSVFVTATGLEVVTYTRLLLAARRAGQVFAFPYDWRRDLRQTAAAFKESVDHWTFAPENRGLTLVGHSMGGLVALTYLALYPAHAQERIQRLILLGTPVRGAVESVISLATGNQLMALMGRLNRGNDAVRMVRSLPGLYQLLPPPPAGFPVQIDYPVAFDLYDASAWPAEGILQQHLDSSRDFHRLLAASDPQLPVVQIAGCNLSTHVAIGLSQGKLRPSVVSMGDSSGDGTVPLWSARLAGHNTFYVEAEHMSLPKERTVIDAVLSLASGEKPGLATVVPSPQAAVSVPSEIWDEDQEVQQLRAAIEGEELSAETLRQLLFLL